MEALQKKCMAASTGVHLLAGAFLVVGSAMLVKEPVGRQFQTITMVPDALVDGALATGGSPLGSPNARAAQQQPEAPAPAQAQQQQQRQQQQEQPAPAPAPVRPAARTRPVQPLKPAPVPDPVPVKPASKPQPSTLTAPATSTSANAAKPAHTVDVNLKPVVRKPQTKPAPQVKRQQEPDPQEAAEAEERAAAEAAATAAANAARQRQAAWEARTRQFGSSLASLQKGLTSGGVTAMPFGPGGTAVADYGAFVVSLYDRAWRSPDDVQDNSATVRAKIVVARDGHIVSAEIVRKSGYPAMDASVRAALDRVTDVGRPFPEDATDKERTYFFNFNLKDKRGTG